MYIAGEVLAALIAAATCAWAAQRTAERLRAAWMLLALSAAAWVIGELILAAYTIGLNVAVPFPSAADAGFLVAIPLAIAGILLFSKATDELATRWRMWLDASIVALSLFGTAWVLLLASVWTDPEPVGVRLLELAYPIGDILIATVLILAIRSATRRQRGRMLLLLAGLATNLVGLSVSAAMAAAGSTDPLLTVIGAASVAGYLVIALAALWPSARTDREAQRAPIDLWQTILPWLAIGAIAETVAWSAVQGRVLDPVLGATVAVLGALVVANQILANRQLLAMLAKSRRGEATLAEMIARAPVGMARLGPDFRIIDANPSLAAMFLESHQSIVGSAIAKYVPAELQQKVFGKLRGLATGDIDTIELESAAVRTDGTQLWVRGTGTIVRTAAGQVDYFLLTLENVSAKHDADEVASQSLAVLERLNRLKSEFLQSVSHEFKTALIGIQGFSELMRDSEELDIKDARAFAGDIYRDADRLDRLVNEMIDLDRVEDGRAGLRLSMVNLNEVIRQTVAEVERTSTKSTISVLLDASLPAVRCDAEKLTGVLRTLLDSALKYTPEGGQVTVLSRLAGQDIEVGVRDEGTGVRADFDNRLFGQDDLYANNPIRKIVGTGLGLGIVRQVVEMHGGRIWVEKMEQGGSEFHFTIPADVLGEVAQRPMGFRGTPGILAASRPPQ
ncbi:MAG TPA: ATP-binding protein [Candidatus Dormibacteraeota bacterium]